MHILDARNVTNRLQKRHHILSDKWLSSCDPHLRNANASQQLGHPEHFLVRQQLAFIHIVNALFRHAVEAPEVTPISDCKAQVVDQSAVIVVEWHGK
jgi:hypothetical protein